MVTTPLYAPIDRELALVEESLQAVVKTPAGLLMDLLGHILGVGGKRLRPAVTLLAGSAQGPVDLATHIPVAAGIELLHTATLVHDDMVDNSLTRRGRATVNSRWNAAAAVLLGDYLFARSAELVAQPGSLRVVRIFARTLTTICEGELAQLDSNHHRQHTLDEYYQRIYCKTASLFAASCEVGAVLSGLPEPLVAALAEYGRLVGMAFQIVDDILDFKGDEAVLGKPVGNDLLQGTVTLPALLLMQQSPGDNPVQRMLDDDNRAFHAREAIALIRGSQLLDTAYSVAEDFCQQARACLQPLEPTPARESLLGIASYVLRRSH